jgi:hypothetical protein
VTSLTGRSYHRTRERCTWPDWQRGQRSMGTSPGFEWSETPGEMISKKSRLRSPSARFGGASPPSRWRAPGGQARL